MSYFGPDLLDSSSVAPNHEHKLSLDEIDKLLRGMEKRDPLYGGLPLYVSGHVPRNMVIVMSPHAFEQIRPPEPKFEWHNEASEMRFTMGMRYTLPEMRLSPFWSIATDESPAVVEEPKFVGQVWIAYLILFLALVALILYGSMPL